MSDVTLHEVRDSYQQLLDVLQREGPAGDVDGTSVHHMIDACKHAIGLLGDAVSEGRSNDPALHHELAEIYERITQPRIGLHDYFVWRDDANERRNANLPLDQLKQRLRCFHQKP